MGIRQESLKIPLGVTGAQQEIQSAWSGDAVATAYIVTG